MGWLRKVGRKINKKLGKVFGSKLGAVIGTVGMFMLMGTITKGLTGWAKSAFGGAGKVGTTVASDAAAAEAIAASGVMTPGAAGSLNEISLLEGKNLNLSTPAVKAVNTSSAAASQTAGAQIINASNNMDKANIAISAIDSSAVTGTLNVSPTITDSLIQDALPALEQNAAVVKANVAELTAGNIPTATVSSSPFPTITPTNTPTPTITSTSSKT